MSYLQVAATNFSKVGIEPKWEDKANEKGGKWVYTVKIAQRNTHLPQYWLNLVCLFLI
jgi:hypothetical protein